LGNERHLFFKNKPTSHPMVKFLPLFMEKYKINDRKFLNVNPISIKNILKII
jgi:hypothetical protein